MRSPSRAGNSGGVNGGGGVAFCPRKCKLRIRIAATLWRSSCDTTGINQFAPCAPRIESRFLSVSNVISLADYRRIIVAGDIHFARGSSRDQRSNRARDIIAVAKSQWSARCFINFYKNEDSSSSAAFRGSTVSDKNNKQKFCIFNKKKKKTMC